MSVRSFCGVDADLNFHCFFPLHDPQCSHYMHACRCFRGAVFLLLSHRTIGVLPAGSVPLRRIPAVGEDGTQPSISLNCAIVVHAGRGLPLPPDGRISPFVVCRLLSTDGAVLASGQTKAVHSEPGGPKSRAGTGLLTRAAALVGAVNGAVAAQTNGSTAVNGTVNAADAPKWSRADGNHIRMSATLRQGDRLLLCVEVWGRGVFSSRLLCSSSLDVTALCGDSAGSRILFSLRDPLGSRSLGDLAVEGMFLPDDVPMSEPDDTSLWRQAREAALASLSRSHGVGEEKEREGASSGEPDQQLLSTCFWRAFEPLAIRSEAPLDSPAAHLELQLQDGDPTFQAPPQPPVDGLVQGRVKVVVQRCVGLRKHSPLSPNLSPLVRMTLLGPDGCPPRQVPRIRTRLFTHSHTPCVCRMLMHDINTNMVVLLF